MKFIYSLALALLVGMAVTPAQAFVAGTVMVSQHSGAIDNPKCYVPLVSTGDATKLLGPPCRHIQYALNLVMTNPGGFGPGPQSTLAVAASGGNPTGSADWRLLWQDNVSSSTTPDIYVEDVKSPASGLVDAKGIVHYFSMIGHSGATILRQPPNSTAPAALWLTGNYVKFGKLDIYGCGPTGNTWDHSVCPYQTKGEGLRIGGDGQRHKDWTVYYNEGIQHIWSIGIHLIDVDGYDGNNSFVIWAGADGNPCMKVENSTMFHIDSDSMKRCGTNVNTPAKPTNGVEVWHSSGSSIGPSMSPDPSYVAKDLVLFDSPNSSVQNNNAGYKCGVVPPADLQTDVVSPAGTCVGQ